MEITTKRNIAYDLEIVSILNGSILEVLATCENGSKEFNLEFDTKFGTITEDNKYEFLNDAVLDSIDDWADATEIGFISGELQKYCISKSVLGEYYSFYIYTFNGCNVVVNILEVENGVLNGKQIGHEQLTGIEQIKEFLNK